MVDGSCDLHEADYHGLMVAPPPFAVPRSRWEGRHSCSAAGTLSWHQWWSSPVPCDASSLQDSVRRARAGCRCGPWPRVPIRFIATWCVRGLGGAVCHGPPPHGDLASAGKQAGDGSVVGKHALLFREPTASLYALHLLHLFSPHGAVAHSFRRMALLHLFRRMALCIFFAAWQCHIDYDSSS